MPAIAVPLQPELDDDAAIRQFWGRNIDDQMETLHLTNKAVAAAMSEQGSGVSVQIVGQWRLGQKAPSPANMVALARVLRIAPRVLFALEVIRPTAVAA